MHETIDEVRKPLTGAAPSGVPRQDATGTPVSEQVSVRVYAPQKRAIWFKRDSRDLYFLENPRLGLIKIGVAADVADRKSSLERSCGVPLTLLRIVPEGAFLEAALLDAFCESRALGEWFADSVSLREVIADPDSIVEFLAYVEDSRRRKLAPPATASAHHWLFAGGCIPALLLAAGVWS